MNIQTRFKDIDYEQFMSCAVGGVRRADGEQWWAEHRGKPIVIETPAGTARNFSCSGPFYKLVGTGYMVCPHMAEIGD